MQCWPDLRSGCSPACARKGVVHRFERKCQRLSLLNRLGIGSPYLKGIKSGCLCQLLFCARTVDRLTDRRSQFLRFRIAALEARTEDTACGFQPNRVCRTEQRLSYVYFHSFPFTFYRKSPRTLRPLTQNQNLLPTTVILSYSGAVCQGLN